MLAKNRSRAVTPSSVSAINWGLGTRGVALELAPTYLQRSLVWPGCLLIRVPSSPVLSAHERAEDGGDVAGDVGVPFASVNEVTGSQALAEQGEAGHRLGRDPERGELGAELTRVQPHQADASERRLHQGVSQRKGDAVTR